MNANTLQKRIKSGGITEQRFRSADGRNIEVTGAGLSKKGSVSIQYERHNDTGRINAAYVVVVTSDQVDDGEGTFRQDAFVKFGLNPSELETRLRQLGISMAGVGRGIKPLTPEQHDEIVNSVTHIIL